MASSCGHVIQLDNAVRSAVVTTDTQEDEIHTKGIGTGLV